MIRKVLKEEKHLSYCGFDYESVDSFVKSQWQLKSKSYLFLVYRWLVAFATIAIVGIALKAHLQKQFSLGLFFIYLTRWGILMNMVVGIYGAILVTTWHFHANFEKNVVQRDQMPITFKIYWALHNIALVMALTITVFYWTVLHSSKKSLSLANVSTHAVNSIIMFVDILIVAFPSRLYHVVQPIAFGVFYTVFSYIYYLCGGLDTKGKPYIYPPLNWQHPEKVMIAFTGVIFLICIIHVTLFWVYKLRVFIQRRAFSTKFELPQLAHDEVALN